MRIVRLYRRCAITALAMLASLPIQATAAEWFQSTGVAGPVVDVLIQGGTSNVVAASQSGSPGIYRSTTHGVTFTKVMTFTRPNRLAQIGGLVFAATSQGLYKSTNLTTWTAITAGLPASANVTYVGVAPMTNILYATVAGGTGRGLYRSSDGGLNWTLVLPNAGTQAITKGWGCGVAENATVFAGGKLSPGAPPCTLLISTDNGDTWSCSTFPYIVNDLQIDCYGGDNFKHVYVTSADLNAVYRSTDMGASFVLDNVGISDCCASNISLVGDEVGTLNFGLYKRGFGPPGTPWTQFDTTGLSDQRINHFVRFDGTVSDYVVATPTGTFYYGNEGPPCPNPPCP